MQRLYDTYQDHVEFVLVYIREAHPDSVLYIEKDGTDILQLITQTNTLVERSQTALACSASLNLSVPTVVDKEDNAVNEAYAGWPDRMVIVGVDGNIAYYGREGPRGFKPNEVEQWLRGFTKAELEIPIWPGTAPGSESNTNEEEYRDREVNDGTDTLRDRSAVGVTKPTLTVSLALQKANVPAELHVSAKGGHGFGIRQLGQPVSSWRERWIQWLQAEEFLESE